MFELVNPDITSYAEEHSSSEDSVLAALNRETHLKVLKSRMLSGHLQGLFLSMISEMVRPETVLEIGTYTGYGTICLAKGLKKGGVVHTIEVNRELETMIRDYLFKAGLHDRVTLHIGKAEEIIPGLNTMFDIVFIDADKNNYIEYYSLIIDSVKPGGVIIADNVLCDGKVITGNREKETRALDAFNKYVQADKKVTNLLLPFRDGIMIIMKNK